MEGCQTCCSSVLKGSLAPLMNSDGGAGHPEPNPSHPLVSEQQPHSWLLFESITTSALTPDMINWITRWLDRWITSVDKLLHNDQSGRRSERWGGKIKQSRGWTQGFSRVVIQPFLYRWWNSLHLHLRDTISTRGCPLPSPWWVLASTLYSLPAPGVSQLMRWEICALRTASTCKSLYLC